MLAMQYGFDVAQAEPVRQRVREIGSRFDRLPGLYQKAFLVADAQAGGSARYAPFYLWDDLAGLTDFLLSDSFRAVVAKYGRPTVQRFNEVALIKGPALMQVPAFAVQQFTALDNDADLAHTCASHAARARAMANEAGLHTLFLGLDTQTWQLMQISLWHVLPQHAPDGRVYEVAHLSAPALRAPGNG